MSVSCQNSFQLKKRKIVRMSPVFVFSHHNLKKKITKEPKEKLKKQICASAEMQARILPRMAPRSPLRCHIMNRHEKLGMWREDLRLSQEKMYFLFSAHHLVSI